MRWEVGFAPIRIRQYGSALSFLREHVRGWQGIILWRLGIRNPFSAVLNDEGFSVSTAKDFAKLKNAYLKVIEEEHCESLLSDLRTHVSYHEKQTAGVVLSSFTFEGTLVKLRFELENRVNALSIIKEDFVDKQYQRLSVKDRDVLDVGANIADTAIYFALRHAKHIIALEPFPKAYEIARENIFENHLSDKVVVLNQAVGTPGKITLSNTVSNGSSELKPNKTGVEVQVRSLDQLVRYFESNDAVMKVDCEGGEYPFILNSSREALRVFCQIQIEYHYGAKLLRAKLEKDGFSVQVLRNEMLLNPNAVSPMQEVGLILANRKHVV